MHIAIDARIINSSTGRYVERLLTYLETLDPPHRFSVLVRQKDVDYWKPTKPNFSIVVADYENYSFAEQIGYYFFLRKLRPDLVHFCMPQQPLLYAGRAVTTIHDLNLLRINENDDMLPPVLKLKQFVFRNLLHTVIRRGARIIVPSQYVRHDVLRFHRVNPAKISVIYEAAEVPNQRNAAMTKPVARYKKTPFLLMVGRTEAYKNHRGAIEALQALLWKHPDLRLVIVGKRDKSSHDLEKWTLDHGYRNVDFFGFASDEQLAWLYQHCRVYVFASYMEGFGLPGLEAMAHGAPVASSSLTSLPEVYGDAASYFNPDDIAGMGEVIGAILDDDELRARLITAGKKQVKKYSWKTTAQQTLDIYNQALENKLD